MGCSPPINRCFGFRNHPPATYVLFLWSGNGVSFCSKHELQLGLVLTGLSGGCLNTQQILGTQPPDPKSMTMFLHSVNIHMDFTVDLECMDTYTYLNITCTFYYYHYYYCYYYCYYYIVIVLFLSLSWLLVVVSSIYVYTYMLMHIHHIRRL